VFSAVRGNDFASHNAKGIDFDATQISLRGFYLAQLAVGVLGVLTITGEYSTGMIRASLSAVPRRTPVLVGKIVVFAVVTFLICTLAALIAFLGGQAALGHYGYGVSLTSPGAARAVIGAGLFLAVVGLLALGCGFALRNTGGAIATLFGFILVLPLLAQALPSSWQDHIDKYLPLPAGSAILATVQDSGSLGPWAGLGVFALYAIAALAVGLVVLCRRDA
jgi:ABC-2 type transport system permease protein